MKRNLLVRVICVVSVMLVAACGGPAANPAPTAAPAATSAAAVGGPGQTVDVIVRDFLFSPKVLTVKKGTTVKWTSQGQANHTVTADDGKSFKSEITPGQSFTFTFDTVGTYAYYCSIHGGAGGQGMSGTITVVE